MFKESAVDHIINKLRDMFIATGDSYRDGFTIYAEDGNSYFTDDDKVYFVGGIIPSIILSTSQTLAEVYVEVTNWYRAARIFDSQPIVGAWVKDGFIHLDLITLCFSEEDALVLGKVWKQEAIGSLDSKGTFKELEIAYV